MNTHEFSIQRFGLLLQSELRKNLKGILIFIGIILGIYLISPIDDGQFSTNTFLPYIGTIIYVLPFVFYKTLFHPTKGIAFGMLPASQSEKFLVMFILCALMMPVGMLVFAWLVSLIGVGLTGHIHEMFNLLEQFTSHEKLGFFNSNFWLMISAQSLSIWGVCFFKSNKLWKTILSAFCVMLGLTIILSIYGFNRHTILVQLDDPTASRLALIFSVFVSIVLPIGLWIWGFFQIRRQQF